MLKHCQKGEKEKRLCRYDGWGGGGREWGQTRLQREDDSRSDGQGDPFVNTCVCSVVNFKWPMVKVICALCSAMVKIIVSFLKTPKISALF